MDGNMSEEGITKDLLSMKKAGIGRVVFLEVNIGIARGPVDFLSNKWLALFRHASETARQLGIEITLGIGPGWTGSGGPWVAPAQSMQHLVSASVEVSGEGQRTIRLPLPAPERPYFGEGVLTPVLKKQWEDFYEDVAVLAFPSPSTKDKINDIVERALYYRPPFSSAPGVPPFFPASPAFPGRSASAVIGKDRILDLTDKLRPGGLLDWTVPAGKWTIIRFGRRNNGAVTRPAPVQGLGFECDKLDTAAISDHLKAYTGKIFGEIGLQAADPSGGLKMLHMDSWEMGAQNWTPGLRKEFIKRRGYDPLPFYPVYAGYTVGSTEISERFLWDLRQTCQELVLEYHAGYVKKYAHRYGLGLSIEPYDMNPTADLALGSIADIPMGEFWSKGYGYNTSFSCIEATSIAHVNGIPIVQAEAFTANEQEAWKQYPGSMKDQGDWALALGINRFFYHTFQHKPWNDTLRPGMTMGAYGVHWDRKQTWWPLVADYHRYITRCQFILQQGTPVADILYLTPEGAPQVFLPPASALTGDPVLPDKRGYPFDGCSPEQLLTATVKDHQIVFPGGAVYRLLVLPATPAMTPELLEKIRSLVKAGATVTGLPPRRAPGLSGFPGCDRRVRAMADSLWGDSISGRSAGEHKYGEGKIIWAQPPAPNKDAAHALYPEYAVTAALLDKMGIPEDFKSGGPVRYHHRTAAGWDIYFVANRTGQSLKANCLFRTDKGAPELWDPVTGETRPLPEFSTKDGYTAVPLQFDAWQSFFIVFSKDNLPIAPAGKNFPGTTVVTELKGPWTVAFDPAWGGPQKVIFDHLTDWTLRPEEGIKYYSGIAVYQKSFDLPAAAGAGDHQRLYLDLGNVKNMAAVTLNGHDLGTVWTPPFRRDVTGIVKHQGNRLEISVANLWPNRLIGDKQAGNKTQPVRKYTSTTYDPYRKDDPLLESGLLGPVTIMKETF
jgi:hypothetical protein